MAHVENVQAVISALEKLKKNGKKVSVIVGYTQDYAIHVHEDLEAFHRVGQAKYLEQPAREMEQELGQIVRDQIKAGRTLTQALLIAGLTLQRASQKLVPVDTGALKGSAFTRVKE